MRINWLGVLVSAVVIVALRYLWYAHFGGADWGHLVGNAVSQIQGAQKVAGMQLINAVLLSLGLAWLVGLSGRSLPAGIGAGVAAGVLFGLTSASDGYIHGAPLKSFMIDGGYVLAAYALGGLILGAMGSRRTSKSKFNWDAAPAAPAPAHGHGHDDHGGHGHGHDDHGGHGGHGGHH
jgi:hypothetical protein